MRRSLRCRQPTYISAFQSSCQFRKNCRYLFSGSKKVDRSKRLRRCHRIPDPLAGLSHKERTLELEKANKKLQNLSIRDELTGLRNRRYADSEISLQINNYRRYNTIFSLLFIDVDKFKSVNDIHGHDNGDKVLKWISTYIKNSIRKTDIPCRIGGDEFVVICSHSTGKNAMVLANKLAANLASECPEHIKEMWSPSISIGVTEIFPAINEACDLLGLADGAMYESKKQGGGRAHML